MTRTIILSVFLLSLTVFIVSAGCDKERVVNSKEYIRETEYVELPPDTIFVIDTVFTSDSVVVRDTDTIRIHDTIRVTTVVHDTVVAVHNNFDTVFVTVTDTVVRTQCLPNELSAIAAMQSQTDPMVFDFILAELGLNGGWVFYQTNSQMEVMPVTDNSWDIYSYVDYWAADWSGYYPLEIYWRLTYTSGDPSNPNNWQMSDPPTAVSGHRPGIDTITRPAIVKPLE